MSSVCTATGSVRTSATAIRSSGSLAGRKSGLMRSTDNSGSRTCASMRCGSADGITPRPMSMKRSRAFQYAARRADQAASDRSWNS
jgi:hypothetical protein